MAASAMPSSPEDAASRRMQELAARTARSDAGHPVPCQVRSGDGVEPGEVSLAENVMPHPPCTRPTRWSAFAEARRRRPAGFRHRRALRYVGAHRRAAAAPRQRRARTARRLPGGQDRPRSAEGLRRHRRPGAPDGGLGAGLGPGPPPVRRAGEAAAHRGARARRRRGRPLRRGGGLRGRRRCGHARPVRRRARARRLVRGPGAARDARHGEAPGRCRRAIDPLEVGRSDDRGRVGRHRLLRPHRAAARDADRRGAGGDRDAGDPLRRAPRPGRPRVDRGSDRRGRPHRGPARRDRGRRRGAGHVAARGLRDGRLHRHDRPRRRAPGHRRPGQARGHAEAG